MKLKHAIQISYSEFQKGEYDFLIAASGYESRATALTEKIYKNAKNRIVIGLKNIRSIPKELKMIKNLSHLGFPNLLPRKVIMRR
jgi:hypothetical protein